jgi:hypothetical protein
MLGLRFVKNILLLSCFLHASDAFIHHSYIKNIKPLLFRQNTCNTNNIVLYVGKNDDNNNKNVSKVFKMDFSEDNDEDWIHKPRYAFGLSEYQFILLKIYVYNVITLYLIGIIINKANQSH